MYEGLALRATAFNKAGVSGVNTFDVRWRFLSELNLCVTIAKSVPQRLKPLFEVRHCGMTKAML